MILLVVGVTLSWLIRIFFADILTVETASVETASIIATAICLICLILYFFAAKESHSHVKSHSPDNLYYMGLLFTLSSLVYSLITLFLFNNGANDITDRVYNLIGSFGIALIATFAGILFRILLLHEQEPVAPLTQNTIDKYNREAHKSLTDAAFKLRQELTQTIADMSVFRQAIIQATHETAKEADATRAAMTRQVEKAAHEQTNIISAMATTMAEKLTATVDEVATSIKHVQEPLDELVAQQTNRMKESVIQAQQNAIQLERSIHASSTKITDGGEQMVTAFKAVLESLQNVTSAMQSTSQNVQTLATECDALNSGLRQSLTAFANTADELVQAAKPLTASAKIFSDSLTSATEVTPQYTQQFEKLVVSLGQEVEKWQAMTKEVRVSLTQAVDALTKAVKRG